MSLSVGFPPLPGDPGGGPSSYIDGTYTGATLPSYMDPHGNYGELIVLRMEPVNGKMPDHPFTLRQSIEKRVNGRIEGAISEAQGRSYALKVRSRHHLEKLLSMTQLIDGTAVKVSYHPGLNSTRCVISCRDLMKMKDDNEILECLKDQNITGIRRITRRVGDNREVTPTVILTIGSTTIPEHIDIGYQRIRTRPYYPAPMICYQCYQFGHTRQRCQKQIATCGNCNQEHDITPDVRCQNPAYCARCNSNDHSVSSRKCPVYQNEDAIQHIRVDRGLSYPEARRAFEASTGQRSFAGIASHSKDKTISDLSAKLEALSGQMMEKDTQIKALEDKMTTGTTSTSSTEFHRLEKMIIDLQKEIQRKDERIQTLEKALEKDSRMDLTRSHGTIEDLVAKVSSLQEALNRKDKEIQALRATPKVALVPTDKTNTKPQRQQPTKTLPSTTPGSPGNSNQKGPVKNAPVVSNGKKGKDTSVTVVKNLTVIPSTPMDSVASESTTGTKPKRGKNNVEQTSAKRTKANEPVMYISDTEDFNALENDLYTESEVIEHDISSSSDETMEDNETAGVVS